LISLLFFNGPLWARSFVFSNIKSLTLRSELIVVATVKGTLADDSTAVNVEDVVKGASPSSRLFIGCLSGYGRNALVEKHVRYHDGERFIFFLQQCRGGYRVVDGIRGSVRIYGGNVIVADYFTGAGGNNGLVERPDADGVALYRQSMPVNECLRRIKYYIQGAENEEKR